MPARTRLTRPLTAVAGVALTGIAVVGGALPASAATAAPTPPTAAESALLLTAAQVPGFTLEGKPIVVPAPAAGTGRCASTLPAGARVLAESFTRQTAGTPTSSQASGDVLSEVVVRTASPAQARRVFEAERAQVRRCGTGTQSVAGTSVTGKAVVRAAAPVRGADRGYRVVLTIKSTTPVPGGGTVTVSGTLTVLVYQVGRNLVALVPAHLDAAESGRSATLRFSSTAATRALGAREARLAVADARRG